MTVKLPKTVEIFGFPKFPTFFGRFPRFLGNFPDFLGFIPLFLGNFPKKVDDFPEKWEIRDILDRDLVFFRSEVDAESPTELRLTKIGRV